jgi:hypothetical protein
MHASIDTRAATAARYTPGAERATVLADALGCIISGRPLPESLRAPSPACARPDTVEEGIRRIVGGATATA